MKNIALGQEEVYSCAFWLLTMISLCNPWDLVDPVNIPIGVITYMASQLSIADPQCACRYAERVQTQQEHAQEIRQYSGYKEFSDRREVFSWG
jgi:hypothetical protein